MKIGHRQKGCKMSYELTTKETYKGGPGYHEKTNFTQVREFDQLDELTNDVVESIMDIRHKFEVLREWEEFDNNCVTKKVLFKRCGKPARLLRTFTVRKKSNYVPKWDDSLI